MNLLPEIGADTLLGLIVVAARTGGVDNVVGLDAAMVHGGNFVEYILSYRGYSRCPTPVEDVVVTTIIPADYAPRCFDRVDGTLYVESMGDDSSHPYAVYGLTIFNFGTWRDVSVSPGNPDTYPADGRQVCIQNAGPSRIKLVYADPPTTPEAAGWRVVPEMPEG